MYQFNAIGSPIAKYSNFTTNLVIFCELTGFHRLFLFQAMCETLLKQIGNIYPKSG